MKDNINTINKIIIVLNTFLGPSTINNVRILTIIPIKPIKERTRLTKSIPGKTFIKNSIIFVISILHSFTYHFSNFII